MVGGFVDIQTERLPDRRWVFRRNGHRSATGELFRIKLQADLKPTLPTVRADIAVEYGPVMIGGKKYLCPVKADSISRARTTRVMQQ
jgi:hypothetical protein